MKNPITTAVAANALLQLGGLAAMYGDESAKQLYFDLVNAANDDLQENGTSVWELAAD